MIVIRVVPNFPISACLPLVSHGFLFVLDGGAYLSPSIEASCGFSYQTSYHHQVTGGLVIRDSCCTRPRRIPGLSARLLDQADLLKTYWSSHQNLPSVWRVLLSWMLAQSHIILRLTYPGP